MSEGARYSSQDRRRGGRGQTGRDGDRRLVYDRGGGRSDRRSPRRDDDGVPRGERRPRDRGGDEAREQEPLPKRLAGWVNRHRRPLVALAIVVVAILALYGPAQRYYVAWRTSGDQQAKADAIDADNDALKQDIERLTTRQGIEDEARQRGYAYPSESSNANSASSDGSSANKGSDATDDDFSYADIEQPWFIHVLDFIFVYNGPAD